MDLDLEIINEEDDCPNHLFESIMNAMNSMKEATADKIYQKIQRDGETNYSKPQVDKALANALKYGIFEVRNNRYRVKNDILEDEDTVYWKLHEKKGKTPLRIQQRVSDKHFGIKLDPERDNQRFRKIHSSEMKECPHCGRITRVKKKKETKKKGLLKNVAKKTSKQKNKKKVTHKHTEASLKNAGYNSRKNWCGKFPARKNRRKKVNKKRKGKDYNTNDTLLEDFWTETQELRESGLFDSTHSRMNYLEGGQDLDKSSKENKIGHNKQKTSPKSQQRDVGEKNSSEFKSDSESERSSVSAPKNLRCHGDFWDSMPEFKEKKISSRNESDAVRNQCLRAREEYHNQYDNRPTDQHTGRTDWLGHSDEPQGTIIQSNNVLTIEPMDTLAFKSPEQASYIT